MFIVWLYVPLKAFFNTWVCLCFFFFCVFIFYCTLLSTEMFGGLLSPMSFCLAALLWTCTAQKMLSNRAAGTAQTRLKTGQASRNNHRPWSAPRCLDTHTHTHTRYMQSLSLCLLMAADQQQNPGGSQTWTFMGTLHVHNAYGRPHGIPFSSHQHRADQPHPSMGRPQHVYLSRVNGSALSLILPLSAPTDPLLFYSVLMSFCLILLSFLIYPPSRTKCVTPADTNLDSLWPSCRHGDICRHLRWIYNKKKNM